VPGEYIQWVARMVQGLDRSVGRAFRHDRAAGRLAPNFRNITPAEATHVVAGVPHALQSGGDTDRSTIRAE